MGIFHEVMGIGNPEAGPTVAVSVSALVDTGATYTMLPASLLSGIGIAPLRRRFPFLMADGREVAYLMAYALLTVDGNTMRCPVILGPEGRFLLGAGTLELFRYKVNPVDERIEPMLEHSEEGI